MGANMSFIDIEDLKSRVQVAVCSSVDADFLSRVSGSGDRSFLKIKEINDATVLLEPDLLEHLNGGLVDGVCHAIRDAISQLGADYDIRDVLARFDTVEPRNILEHELEHHKAIPWRLRTGGINLIFYETYRPEKGFSLHCCGVGSMGDVTPAVAAWVQTAPGYLSDEDINYARRNVGLTKNPKLSELIEDRIAQREMW